MTQTFKRLSAAFAFLLSLAAPISAQAYEVEPGPWSDQIHHIMSRGISVIQTDDGPVLIVIETTFDTGAPVNLHLGLGKDGMFDPGADLGRIAKTKGLQVFEAPTTVNLSDFDALYIWDATSGKAVGMSPLG